MYCIAITIFLFGCDSADDSNEDTVDAIIGKWIQVMFSTIEDGVTTDEQLSACEQMSALVFSSNGTLTSTSYADSVEGCEIEESAEGTWRQFSSGIYEVTLSGETIKEGISISGDLLTFRYESTEEQIIYVTVLQKVK